MKNFLAIDTSNDYMSVVAMKEGVATTAFLPDCAMRHSVALMETVDDVLSRAQMRVEDCDFFAAAVGAGSFTGIRIGISAAKGFALATGKPTLGVTSFDVAAYNAVGGTPKKILCLINALHDHYYACGYENGKVILPPAFLAEEEVLSFAAQGFSFRACGELPLSAKAAVEIVSPVEGLKNAVLAKSENGAFGELVALYVRKSSAEINLCK
ncbi:MAG: tRNA (adenosine(37)-N6)-threonylcarbamoyltransferase complex dimerization subunit type 1 TsaB [Clostridia bacterium]|nr:tRNA (adenosine(37)-N6)-threonylcarbamoyltransferase complex dimerization subunit type 1 TsaB [Clostridia bacterium]